MLTFPFDGTCMNDGPENGFACSAGACSRPFALLVKLHPDLYEQEVPGTYSVIWFGGEIPPRRVRALRIVSRACEVGMQTGAPNGRDFCNCRETQDRARISGVSRTSTSEVSGTCIS